MRALALALVSVAISAAPLRAQEALSSAFASARESAQRARTSQETAAKPRAALFHAESFVPQNCTVESWCLVKATDCFLGMVTRPQGLWQGHAQYSVVRRAVVLCPAGYGQTERRVIMGPVEPQPFSSDVETEQDVASESALKLCRVYRQDWVSAAPVCPAN